MAMGKNVNDITCAARVNATKKDLMQRNIFRSGIFVITDYSLVYKLAGIRQGQPYRSREPRLMIVTSGEAEVEINGIGFHLHTNSVVMVPENGIVEILSIGADFNGQALVLPLQNYGDRYGDMLSNPQHLRKVTGDDAEMLKGHIRMFHELLSQPRSDTELADLAEPMVTAMLRYLFMLYSEALPGTRRAARPHDLFNEFVNLANRKIMKERNVTYYADRLGITVNYLNILVKKFSHISAKEWLELAVCREAKMLLNGSKDNLDKIAAALGFCNATQFGTFFRKHTGKTPMEYRNRKEIPLGEAKEEINS